MGALVPFPTVKAQGAQAATRVPADSPAKVIILPVVQYLRSSATATATASAAGAARDPR